MPKRHKFSIRARLTFIFVLAVAAILSVTGVSLVRLVHHSLTTDADNQIQSQMIHTQEIFANARAADNYRVILAMHGDVVIQITNLAGTKVWAASSAIAQAPVLARSGAVTRASDRLALKMVSTSRDKFMLSQITSGQIGTISTRRGPGLIFGFLYGEGIDHSVDVLMASLVISFPLLLLITGGLIWIGMGLALAPVESIRRRVDTIAATDLSQRVPPTGGNDEIARMARTVNAMLDRLETSSQFEQEFVSNASHELRSPLTTLLATTERAAKDPDRADWSEVGEVVMREGRRLETLIDDLAWLARHDEHRAEIQSVDVDLDDLLLEEGHRVRLLSELCVDTTMVRPTRVTGDPAMLKRMIRNVVDNAARYATEELRFDSHYEGAEAVVTVADDGEGIDVSQSERFFERFVRSDPARARHSGGTGLGLAIVAEIVERHGGSSRFVATDVGTKIELRVLRDRRASSGSPRRST
jgi:signal transduction histidine kinase